jgi:hypothetical protein
VLTPTYQKSAAEERGLAGGGLAVAEKSKDPGDVGRGLSVLGDSSYSCNDTRSGVIGRKCKRKRRKPVQLLAQIASATIQILSRIVAVHYTEKAGGARHQLG